MHRLFISTVIIQFIALIYSSQSTGQVLTPGEKPNVVLIMADDLGYGSLSCYGAKDIKTPNIDKLAATGLKLTDFHSNGTVCSPTRAALMTGRYQQRCDIDGVITAKNHRHKGMPHKEFTFPEMMKKAGYSTGIFGKWHLGYQAKFGPTTQGFDEFQGFVSGNIDLFSHIDQEGWFDWWENQNLVYRPGYAPNKMTSGAVNFIHKNKKKPFFLYLPYPAPHSPYQGPKDSAIRKVTKGWEPKELAGMKLGPQPKGKAVKRTFIKMIEDLDLQVGRVVNELEKAGVRENTLIIFCSDNGGAKRPVLGQNRNGILRAGKGSLFEGGHRVPAIINWPRKISPGISDQTVLTFDFMPTIADLLGQKPPVKFDGISINNHLLYQKKLPDRELLWMYGDRFAYRFQNWKLILQQNGVKLFDLKKDISEQLDVSKSNPALLEKLTKKALKLHGLSRSDKSRPRLNLKPDKTIKYKQTAEGDLFLHAFFPSKEIRGKKDRPAIVYFFGGGWVGGTPKQFYPQAKALSELGFVAFCAEYRVAKKHKTSPFECVMDGKSAIRWVRSHAKELGIDPKKIIAAGGSAGGHVAACTALIKDRESGKEMSKISSVPNAMILYNPVLDTTEKGYGLKKVGRDRKTEISPVHHVRENLPPTIVFHGTADKTVPFSNITDFSKKMKTAKNRCQVIPFTARGHGFFNARTANGIYDYHQTNKKVIQFLKKEGFLN